MDAVPIFEAKNKLPFYIHQAEESGPVFISRHTKSLRPAGGKLAGVKKTASPRWRKPSARVCERKTLTVVLLFYIHIT